MEYKATNRVIFHKRAFQEANCEIASHSNRRRHWIYFFQLNFRSFFSLLFLIIKELNEKLYNFIASIDIFFFLDSRKKEMKRNNNFQLFHNSRYIHRKIYRPFQESTFQQKCFLNECFFIRPVYY